MDLGDVQDLSVNLRRAEPSYLFWPLFVMNLIADRNMRSSSGTGLACIGWSFSYGCLDYDKVSIYTLL